ncbi:amidophosphoribosyltransferase [Candidatus Kaiserbacteria bacterium]|nr:amidophosphoribosyltransferase [Candidatus Kaiserbacteria bacterium]
MCGVFAVCGTPEAAKTTSVGLHHLQHRGQEAGGIVSFEGEHFYEHREGGLIGRIFNKSVVARLSGTAAIGQVRYSTSGVKHEDVVKQARDAQPMLKKILPFGTVALAHNGNLTNAKTLQLELALTGKVFETQKSDDEMIDTEVALMLIGAAIEPTLVGRLKTVLPLLEGAYAFIVMTSKQMIGVCDPLGIRPLMLGRYKGAWMLASETCAIEGLDAEFVRPIQPGEMIAIEDGKITSHTFSVKQPSRLCIFEHIYFSKPDSTLEGKSVMQTREALGRELAREASIDADIVCAIPDSGNYAALGFSQESGIPFAFGIIRHHYVGRVFIQPPDERDRDISLKHNIVRAAVQGKRVVLVDDSLVRGITAQRIVARLKRAGAREVHLRLSSPPWQHGCYYGIDEANVHRRVAKPYENVAVVCEHVCALTGADSVAYLSVDGMYRAVHGEPRNSTCAQSCDACFTGRFPTPLTDRCGGRIH